MTERLNHYTSPENIFEVVRCRIFLSARCVKVIPPFWSYTIYLLPQRKPDLRSRSVKQKNLWILKIKNALRSPEKSLLDTMMYREPHVSM